MEVIKFQGELREKSGKGPARQARRSGYIPGVLYGPGGDPVAVNIEAKSAEKIIRRLESHNVIADLALKKNGSEETVKTLLKEIQINPLNDALIHLDFYRVRMDKRVVMEVSVHAVGESVGVKEGGILDQEMRELKVEALPIHIPDRIDVEISALKIGDAVLVKDLKLPEGVRAVEPEDRVVIAILAPAKEEEPAPAEAAVEAAVAAEPEVISAEKAEERRKAKEESKEPEEKGEKKTEKTEKKAEKSGK